MGCGASSSVNSSNLDSRAEDQEERIYENPELQQLLTEGEDVTSYTIQQIAKCKMPYPVVEPSTLSKQDILSSNDLMKSQDAMRNVLALLKYSSNELVTALTEGLEGNLYKTRAIYLFIASLDLAHIEVPEGEEVTPNSPLEFIIKIKNYKGNHAHLFCALCRIAQVPCEVVSGYNKSSLYQLGKAIDTKKLAAQWSAVYVEGEWRLVDCFWSSVCVVGNEDEDEWDVLDVDGRIVTDKKIAANHKITHRINEFYYLTDPGQFIATHIPRDSKWQLLDGQSKITLADFEQASYKRERFFELDLRLPDMELNRCKLRADQGEATIELEIPNDSPSIDFKYMLFMAKSNDTDGKFEMFVMFVRGNGVARYTTNIPVKGIFKLDIFGKDSRKHNSMDLVCSYLIDCGWPSDDKEPLPDDPAIGWGAEGGYLGAYGMEPVTHTSGVITTSTGEVDIKFTLSQPVELMCIMLSNSHTKEQLRQYVYLEVTSEECVIHVTLPKAGLYACELFANEEGIPGELQNVCNYVIKCYNKRIKHGALPYIPNGKAGVFSGANAMGVEVLEPQQPAVISKDGKLQVKVKTGNDINLWSSLYHTHQNQEAANQQISMSKDCNIVTFDLNLLMSGKHCFALYTSTSDDSQLQNVFNCLVDNQSSSAGAASKPADLPEIEKMYIKDGKAVLCLSSVNAPNVLASLYREGVQLDQTSGQVTVTQERTEAKVIMRIPEDGEYTANLYERSQSEDSVVIKKRFLLIHRGGVSDTQEESTEEIEEEKEEEEMSVEEEASPEESEEARMHRELRQKLLAAIESGREEDLEEAIKEFKAAGDIPDPKKLLERTERELCIIRARRELEAATQSEDMEALEKAIIEAKAIKHKSRLNKEISMATRRLEKLIKMDDLRNAVFKLDQRTVAEIKSFSAPPEAIKTVMKGTLLLLGNTAKDMRDWRAIVALIGKTGKESLKRRVMEFRVRNLSEEVANEAKLLLDPMSPTEVRDSSTGASTFYLWSLAMIEEVEQRKK